MNKFLISLCGALLMGLSFSATASPAKIGASAPDFTLTDAEGNSVSLSDYRGQHVVLEWTNHLCPFVQKHYDSGNMQAHQREAAERDVVWLSIISSAPGKQGHVTGAEALRIAKQADASPERILIDADGTVGRQYGAKTTPHMYIVDPDGTLIYMGGIDSIPSADRADIKQATPYVRVALNQALAGEAVSEANTRPYGCSVKY